MGRKSLSGGVKPKGRNRIEFTLFYQGKRYRPTLERTPSEGNLRRARIQLADINRRISEGTFSFADEFPDYRYLEKLQQATAKQRKLTCGEIFDRFIAHCSTRVAMNDMAYSTLKGYEKILDAVWRPAIRMDWVWKSWSAKARRHAS